MSRAETGRHNPAAMLRAQGTPARARCGFGGYFGSGAFEDHWVCEYWDEAAPGWKLADFQIDEVQLKLFDVDFDLTAAYTGDPRLRVPPTVRNAVLNRTEPVLNEDREQLPPS
jgi:hypothetical protein